MGTSQSLIKYNQSDIVEHNKRDDIWIVYDNKVYDVTEIVNKSDNNIKEIFVKSFGGRDITTYWRSLKKLRADIGTLYPIGELETKEHNIYGFSVINPSLTDIDFVDCDKCKTLQNEINVYNEEIKYYKNEVDSLTEENTRINNDISKIGELYKTLQDKYNAEPISKTIKNSVIDRKYYKKYMEEQYKVNKYKSISKVLFTTCLCIAATGLYKLLL